MNENQDTFNYTYSARQQEEIQRIREKYIPKEENKMEKLRKLDAGATKPGMVVSLTVGIIGALFLGMGMCCTMVWAEQMFIPGIFIGIIGIIGLVAAYPLYTRITEKQRKKLAPEIMKLTEELMK